MFLPSPSTELTSVNNFRHRFKTKLVMMASGDTSRASLFSKATSGTQHVTVDIRIGVPDKGEACCRLICVRTTPPSIAPCCCTSRFYQQLKLSDCYRFLLTRHECKACNGAGLFGLLEETVFVSKSARMERNIPVGIAEHTSLRARWVTRQCQSPQELMSYGM
eukprot:3039853-Amphidinium_carterae.2